MSAPMFDKTSLHKTKLGQAYLERVLDNVERYGGSTASSRLGGVDVFGGCVAEVLLVVSGVVHVAGDFLRHGGGDRSVVLDCVSVVEG